MVLVDDKPGQIAGILRHLVQARTVFSCDTAPPFILVSVVWAGAQALAVVIKVAAGDTGPVVPGAAATPQAFLMAAFARMGAGNSCFAVTH